MDTIRNQTGQAVRGSDFFPRPREVQRLWKAVLSGGHILLAAPRRVGKTSLVEHLRENPFDDYHFVYLIVESVNDNETFFRKLYTALFDANASDVGQMLKKTKDLLLHSIQKIGVAGVNLEINHNNISWYEQFLYYVEKLVATEKFENTHLVIVIDEFPQIVANIAQYQGKESAIHFLQENRELRHRPSFHNKVQFIYTGSIGLEHIVATLGVSKTINDIEKVTVEAMAGEDARALIQAIVQDPTYDIDAQLFTDDIITHILQKVQWLIPFYIQLLLKALDNNFLGISPDALTTEHINTAFHAMLSQRNHFEHWVERLQQAFHQEEYRYAKQVLNNLSYEGATMDKNQLYDMSMEHNVQEVYRHIVNALEHDGYIAEEQGLYRFTSPVVQAWWKKNVTQ